MRVKIEKLDHYGRGITWIDNKICFIPNSLPREVVDIDIITNKKKFMIGSVNDYIELSSDRVNNLCPFYNKCGGCSTMHMKYDLENKFKYDKVCELVEKFTNLDRSIVKECVYDKEYNYRNKIVLHCNNKELGLYEEDSHKLIPIDECFLVNNKINRIISYLKQFVKNNTVSEIMIRVGNITNEVMVSINGEVNDFFHLLEIVDVLVINEKTVSKKSEITSIIGNKKFLVSDNAFFQVNGVLTKKLYDEVYSAIKSNDCKNVLDLYCGTGTIGIYISELVDKVLGIEAVRDAVNDANYNKKINRCENISFISGRVEDILSGVDTKFDTIIVDPPRSGLDNTVIGDIYKIRPKTLIYVSCEPSTLMRDLKLLNKIYDVEYIKPFNMFPKTYHVECVCLLKLR